MNCAPKKLELFKHFPRKKYFIGAKSTFECPNEVSSQNRRDRIILSGFSTRSYFWNSNRFACFGEVSFYNFLVNLLYRESNLAPGPKTSDQMKLTKGSKFEPYSL